MLKVICVLVVALSAASASDDMEALLEGTELAMTFLIHRHGDRTPLATSLPFSTDPEKLAKLSEPIGYGQLTDKGKSRGFKLGQVIRDRYDAVIAPKYNHSEIYIRSTDSTRTKMTILTALAAIFPPKGENWNKDLAWTPVPYTTVPAKYDFNLAYLNCPVFMAATNRLFSQPASMTKFRRVLNRISGETFNASQFPVLAYPIYDVYDSQISLGLPLPKHIEEVLPEVREAAGVALGVIYGDEKYISYAAGPLLNEFYTYAKKIQNDEDTQTVRIYSAHDINVFAMLSITQVGHNAGVPKYGSAYALELRRVEKTGQYVVVPVYLPSPEEDIVYLQVKGCEKLCGYQKFVDITSKNARDESTWRKQCGFSDDMVVDVTSIA